MSVTNRTHLKNCAAGVLLAGGMLAAMRMSGAQSVLWSPPPAPATTQQMQDDATNSEMSVFIPAGSVRDNSLPEPFRFGPVTIRPHPQYSFVYGNGVQSSTNNGQNTIIQSVSPGVSVDLGRHWTLDYTPTFQFYSSRQFHDTVSHAVSLMGGTRYEDWVLGLSQTFVKSDAPIAETAAQTEQEQYTTSLTASRSFNNKLSADFAVNQNFLFVTGGNDSREWSTMEWLNYQFWPRLNGGIGLGGGYVDVDPDSGVTSVASPASDQTYEQLQARLNWRATDKISFAVNGGLDYRQYDAAGVGNSLNPVYGASVQYLPFKQTQITLAASRTVSESDYYILSQSSVITSVSLNLNQRLLEKFNLNLGLGYTDTEYDISLGPISGYRTDNNYSFTASLGRSFLKRGNVALTYQFADNTSTAPGFTYHSSQIGFTIGFSY